MNDKTKQVVDFARGEGLELIEFKEFNVQEDEVIEGRIKLIFREKR